MSCPTEDVLATYADGELPGEAAREMAAHVGECSRCGERLEALRGETRLLITVLEAAPEPAPRSSWFEGIALALVLLTAAAAVRGVWQWLGSLGDQAPVDVVDERSLVLTALFEAVFFLIREGASMLTSLLRVMAVLAVVATVLVLSLWRRRSPGVLLLVALLALAGPSSFALELRHAHKGSSITIPAGETIDDSLLASGETVTIDGVVERNVLALGRRVSIGGTVRGDLVVLAQRVDIDGSVEGNVVSFSEDFTLRGPVGRSLHVFAKHTGIEKPARVDWDALAFSQDLDVDGGVGKDLVAFAAFTNLRGAVGRNVSAWTGQLRVEDAAQVGGDLTAHVDGADKVTIDKPGAIAGKTSTIVDTKGKKEHGSRYARPSFYFWKIVWLVAAFLTGLVLQRLWPALFGRGVRDVSAGWWLGAGLLFLIIPPVAAVLLGLTLVGLPLALLTVGVWMAVWYLSGIVVAAVLGSMLLVRGKDGARPPFAAALLVGLLAVTIAVNLPYLGGLAKLVVVLLGFGIVITRVARSWRAPLPAAG